MFNFPANVALVHENLPISGSRMRSRVPIQFVCSRSILGKMRQAIQVAAVLCSYRVSAFVTSNLRAASTLRRESWSSSPSAYALSSPQSRQQPRNQVGITTAASTRHVASIHLAVIGDGDEDGDSGPVEDFGSGVPVDKDRVAVLFDFDGTIGDTETPAMEVAYWEIAPYFPGAAVGEELVDIREYVRNNAGKAFEFMLEKVEADRASAGLPDIATVRAEASEHPEIMKIVDKKRAEYGLKSMADLRAAGELKDILTQQKEETVAALSVVARPVEGMEDTLKELNARSLPFAIATTSPKPRVPASVKACGLEDYFPADKIHSGESDFDPPRFKPDPSVYLKAAQFEGVLAPRCVAVEDSLSGVGSAANADIGMIVGYVGASHITDAMKTEHAKSLRVRGARVVINDMKMLIPLVECFNECMAKGEDFCEPIAKTIDKLPRKGIWE